MAIVTVRMARGHGTETKRKLVEALTTALTDTLSVPRADVTILIEEYARENWSTGGEFNGEHAPAPMPDLDAIFRKPAERNAPEKAPAKATAKAPVRKAAAKSRSRR
ncbi:MAG TPA: tautomerase family protein [Rhizomicrobium sp.]|jgi:4-oxalocrotonate tautomerase